MDEDKELIGDKIEKVLNTLGADKVAAVYEKVTKKPCGCAKRKQAMNKLHQQMIEMQQRVLDQQKKNVPNK